ncbi:MAG TPA: hypothetical protein VK469_02575 [Candidatus Kapabacteria bacterium]|nr:hypothetical protein [Candidatus Kapabacteria bacterium]
MALSDLERIKQLEKEIGIKLERLRFGEIIYPDLPGFALDEHEQVIGI